MKSTLIILLVTFYSAMMSQTKPGSTNTPTAQTPAGKLSHNSTVQAIQYLKHDTCLYRKFSVVIYLFQDSLNSVNAASLVAITATLLTPIINKLNAAFSPLCVAFENCSTVVIPNSAHTRWTPTITDSVVFHNWYTEKTINLYLPRYIFYLPYVPYIHRDGYGTPPNASSVTATPKDMIVVARNQAMIANNFPLLPPTFEGATLLHAFGDYFGLPHTFEETNLSSPASPPPPAGVISHEYVDGSNCYVHGDGFCDTEADPYPAGVGKYCYFKGGAKDGKGDYYNPPLDNIMSNYGCRCRFTNEQYYYMAHVMMTKRKYLH